VKRLGSMKRLFLRSTFTSGSTLSAQSEPSGYEKRNSVSTPTVLSRRAHWQKGGVARAKREIAQTKLAAGSIELLQ